MKYGRLCNRLFNSAHILALAIENNHTFANLAFYDYAKFFRATQNDIFCRYPVQTGFIKKNRIIAMLLYYSGYHLATFLYYLSKIGFNTGWLRLHTVRPLGNKDKIVLNLDGEVSSLPIDFANTAQIVFFQGWELRSFACLKKHGDKVREYFKPADVYLSDIKSFIQENREGYDLLIGIVIRHGNYRKWLKGKYFYPIDKYVNFMKQLKALFSDKKIRFLIFSDEEQDTNVFKSANIDFFFRSGHMIENLYSLAECDYIVSAPSTYGAWGSFYGQTPLCIINDPDQIITITDSFAIYEG
jgi:hypothetical protein